MPRMFCPKWHVNSEGDTRYAVPFSNHFLDHTAQGKYSDHRQDLLGVKQILDLDKELSHLELAPTRRPELLENTHQIACMRMADVKTSKVPLARPVSLSLSLSLSLCLSLSLNNEETIFRFDAHRFTRHAPECLQCEMGCAETSACIKRGHKQG